MDKWAKPERNALVVEEVVDEVEGQQSVPSPGLPALQMSRREPAQNAHGARNVFVAECQAAVGAQERDRLDKPIPFEDFAVNDPVPVSTCVAVRVESVQLLALVVTHRCLGVLRVDELKFPTVEHDFEIGPAGHAGQAMRGVEHNLSGFVGNVSDGLGPVQKQPDQQLADGAEREYLVRSFGGWSDANEAGQRPPVAHPGSRRFQVRGHDITGRRLGVRAKLGIVLLSRRLAARTV